MAATPHGPVDDYEGTPTPLQAVFLADLVQLYFPLYRIPLNCPLNLSCSIMSHELFRASFQLSSIMLPHNRRTWMPEFLITILTISTILLGVRLTSRIRGFGGGSPGIDDVFIIFGWLFSLASGTCVLIGMKYSLLSHVAYVA